MDAAVGDFFAKAAAFAPEQFNAYLHAELLPNFAKPDLPFLRNLDPMHQWSALHIACGQKDPRVVANLLQCPDVDVNQATRDFMHTPLHVAACCGAADVVRVLAQHNVRLNAKDTEGFTALHHAAAQGYRAVVEELLRGLSLKGQEAVAVEKDNYGNSPHEIAFQCANGKCAEIIGDFVNRFVPQAGGTDEETAELKQWLRDVVKLPQYFVYFVKNGYTRLSYWSERGISREEFESIGVVLRGHQRIISHFLEEYKKQSSGTAVSEYSSTDDGAGNDDDQRSTAS